MLENKASSPNYYEAKSAKSLQDPSFHIINDIWINFNTENEKQSLL